MAEANHNSEQMISVFSDFQKALECPICLEVVKKPFKQCVRGHLVCVPCLRTLASCPTCKGELLLENPVCIQNLLEYLPRGCRYSADGCKEMVHDENDHERFCGFRRIKCRQLGCTQKVLAKKLPEHVEEIHPNIFILKSYKNNVVWPGYQSKNVYPVLPVSLFNSFFYISMDNNDDEQLKITFESIPIGKVDGDYYAKLTFAKENICYTYTLKASPVEESEQDSDLSDGKAEVNRVEHFCMKVPKSMLSNFIDRDGMLEHDVFFFKG